MLDLTERQEDLYNWIKASIQTDGYPPTLREIGIAFKIRSPNGVTCHLRALEKKGYLTHETGKARTIKILK